MSPDPAPAAAAAPGPRPPGPPIGRVGLWTFSLDQHPAGQAGELAAELEALGYGAIWIPEAVGRDPFVSATLLLGATERIVVGTGIATIYSRDPLAMNTAWQAVTEAFPDRFLLGLGVSHRPMVEGLRAQEYRPPLTAMREYLDGIDAAMYAAVKPTTAPARVLAALGPKMLDLARERSLGAHPYNVTPDHTARAREILGPDRLLAPEQKVILETDPGRAREVARSVLAIYFPGLPNYVNNARRLGFTEEDVTQLSDRLVDGMIAWGDEEAIAARVRAHHDAGADHVAVQVLARDDPDRVMDGYRRLTEVLW